MQKLNFKIEINSPKEKVWDTMLEDKTYRIWTTAFAPDSHYVGSWEKGNKILFLTEGDNGKMQGMISRIKENKKYEFISIEHIGMVQDGKEDTTSDAVKLWAGALENYTLRDNNGSTEIMVEMDSNEEYAEMFESMWPKALQKLKEISEK